MIPVAVIAQAPAVRAGLRVLLASDPALSIVGDAAGPGDLRHPPLSAASVAVIHGALGPAPLVLPDPLRGVLFLVDDWTNLSLPLPVPHAWAVLPSDAGSDELTAAVNALFHGLITIHPDIATQLLQAPAPSQTGRAEPLVEPLTSRELEVLQLIGQGLANKMIAERLHISEHTVKFHVSAIYAKLGVASRTEAVRAGARRGLIVL